MLDILHSRLGTPLSDVAHELERLGFRCQKGKADYWEFQNYACSRYNLSMMSAPRIRRDHLEADLLAVKGETVLSNYRVAESR